MGSCDWGRLKDIPNRRFHSGLGSVHGIDQSLRHGYLPPDYVHGADAWRRGSYIGESFQDVHSQHSLYPCLYW